MLGIIGAAIVGLGTGFANNTFTLNLQNLGVSEQDLESPIKTANVDLELKKILEDPDGVKDSGDEFFKNVISECSFHTPDGLLIGSTIICKLTDEENKAIAEGRLDLTTNLPNSATVFIPISQEAFPLASDVQKVHDVKIVVRGPNPVPTPRPLVADFGDAPEDDEMFFCSFPFPTNYPSRLASAGPFHTDFDDVWLGPQPNTETAEGDAKLPNCEDWVGPPCDEDDGPSILLIPPASGWATTQSGCNPGGPFGPSPGPDGCYTAFWTFDVSVGGGAPSDVDRFANVVIDPWCLPLQPIPDGFYGDVPGNGSLGTHR